MNNMGFHNPCSFCKQPNSQNSFILQMNKVLYKYRMYPMQTGLRLIVPMLDDRNIRCKFGMSCNQIQSTSATVNQLNMQFIALLTNLHSSQSPVDRVKLKELLADTSRLYPRTVAEYRRIVSRR